LALRGSIVSNDGFENFAGSTEFRLVPPERTATREGRFAVRRRAEDVPLVELPNGPLDWLNTRLRMNPDRLRSTIRPLLEIPRLSTIAIGALLNEAVRCMDPDHAFVNVGVWNGFTFLSGMAGNPEKRCIGVDNFSTLKRPRDALLARFDEAKSPRHEFHEMDYRHYFSSVHEGTIGVYLYDGDHSLEDQHRGLEIAERFFADGCLVLVDDTNWPAPRRGTFDFVADSENDYELLLDATTSQNVHPTYWNGVMVLRMRKNGSNRSGVGRMVGDVSLQRRQIDRSSSGEARLDLLEDYRGGSEGSPLASLIVCNEERDGSSLATAIDSALRQTWPAMEVLVAELSGSEEAAAVIGDFGDRVRVAPAGSDASPSLAHAIDASRGAFVSLFDAEMPLRDSAVHLGVGYPSLCRFSRGRVAEVHIESAERTLLAADDIAAVIPPGGGYVLISDLWGIPETVRSRRIVHFLEPGEELSSLNDEAAVRRLTSRRDSGARHVVVLQDAFGWLRAAGATSARVEEAGRRLLENDRVLITDLG
jgi:Methyltransferase domain